MRIYPGSPLIVQRLLRPQDRLVACELEPQILRRAGGRLRGDRRAKALAIDGWTALNAYVPPKERRGLVLIDPPFEDGGRFRPSRRALAAAHRKWRDRDLTCSGTRSRTREAPDALGAPAAAARHRQNPAQRAHCRPAARTDAGLAGSGLIVVNPPFTLEQDLRILLPTLSADPGAAGGGRQLGLAGDVS